MSRGKKILTIFVVLLVVLGGGALWLYHSLNETRKELDAIAEPMIRELVTDKWNGDVFNKYASSKLKKEMADNKITNGFSSLVELGNVKEYKGVQQFNMMPEFAILVSDVQFEAGDAYVSLQLCKCDGKWLMDAFHIDGPALLNILGDKNAK